jgi:hypothetical protein
MGWPLGENMEFIDIRGASGTMYRFRRWPQTGLTPPIAGNIALVAGGSGRLLALGMLDDLSRAPTALDARDPAVDVFTRYNIPRRCREAEHADMLAEHPDLGRSALVRLEDQAA